MSKQELKFSTLAVHAGAEPDATTKASITPIYQTAAYTFKDSEHAANLFGLKEFGNIYTRIMNPTNAVLEDRIAALEGGSAALAVASGHAAQQLVFHSLLTPGDEFIASTNLYGGSINQFGKSFKSFGWQVVWADQHNLADFKNKITTKTKAIFVESLANPGGVMTDIAAIAEIAHQAGIPLIVDNTMASPYLCQPLKHGADIVVHSLTKFLGGHGNSIGGVIVDGGSFDWSKSGKFPILSEPLTEYNDVKLHETFGPIAFAIACRVMGLRDLGPALAPFNAFLILTGIETLHLRVARHAQNALAVAKFLAQHPQVSWVNYIGLPDNKNHQLAQRYLQNGFGSVFTFGVNGGYEAGRKLAGKMKLFSHLANIGDTRSLIIHPASTTHSQLSGQQKESAGAGDDVVRISVGIEDEQDIIADLDQALSATG